MRRLLVAVAAVLLLATIGIALAVALRPEPTPPAFTEAEAEETMESVLERCAPRERHGKITCELAGGRFNCRARGGYSASFEVPDAEQPEISVTC